MRLLPRRKPKDEETPEQGPSSIEPPIRVVVGFVASDSAKDAESFAKGYIQHRFEAQETSWFAVAPFRGGFFYECHEGGNGVGYLPEVVEKLSQDSTAGTFMLPSGNRVLRITMREGKPLPMLLNEEDSRALLGGSVVFAVPTGKMKEAVKSGLVYVHIGVSIMVFGTILLFSSIGYYLMVGTVRNLDHFVPYDQMPYRQWKSISKIPEDSYVNRLLFEAGRWHIDYAKVSAPNEAAGPNGTPGQRPVTQYPGPQMPPPISHGAVIQRPASVEMPKAPNSGVRP